MNKYKSLAVGFLMAAVIVSTPTISFAQNDNEKGNDNSNKQTNVEIRSNFEKNMNGKFHSFWNKFAKYFNHKDKEKNQKDQKNNLDPNISGITAPTVLQTGEVGTWTVNASDPQNGALTYAVNWGDNAPQPLTMMTQPVFVQTSNFTHSYAIAGNYKITFTVSNVAGLKTKSTTTVHVSGTVTDTTAPVISNIVTLVNGTNVIVSWSTNEPATSSIFYTTGTPVNISTAVSVVNTKLVKNHSLSIPSLASSTLYHFILKSADASNNSVLSSESSLVTNS